MRKLLCIGFFLLSTLWAIAVETIIIGEVVNETTGEPIPNVNIHFRGTKVGTTSDENGAFAIRVDLKDKLQLVFSSVGYYKQRFEIEPGAMAGLQVTMRERTTTLTEVIVSPNENPALEILRQVRAHRNENDRTLHPEWSTTAKREQTLYISHIQRKHLRRALWRSLQAGMISREDSTYILPLYRETQSFRLSGQEMIPANDQIGQALILSTTDYSSLLGGEGNFNFYANSISLMGHAFLSPLASSGNIYYRYYLSEEDSTTFTIHFRTRNPFYATFNGEMEIDTATYALRAIRAYVPAEVAVNYINQVHLSQVLAPDNTIVEEHISILLDFAVATDQAGTVFPTILVNTHLTANQTTFPSPIVSNELNEANSLSVEDHRIQSDSIAFAALDSIPLIRTARWIATIATTGYIPTGTPIDIGHIEEILQVNEHEGVHFGLPFRTNEKFSKIVSLEASVGYGIRDKAAKGLGRVSLNLPTTRKNILQLEYQDHYVWSEVDDFDRLVRENSMGWGNMDFTAYAFEALHRDSFCYNTAMRQRQIQLHWFSDWSPNIETHLYFRAGWNNPTYPEEHSYFAKPEYAFQSLNAIIRLSWGERKYDGFFIRRYAYSTRFPIVAFGLETVHWTSCNSDSHQQESKVYAHLRLLVSQHIQLGIGGTLNYVFHAGAIFGKVPSTMLWQANGNQGYAYDPYRFTLLHGGEMAANYYTTLQAEWNGQGILFNLIPGIRWLHLRELVEAKIAYGYLSGREAGVNGLQTAGSNLYAEVGIGIGNIARVCDLYSVWSLVPTSYPFSVQSVGSSMWAIRFRIHLGL